MAIVKQRTKLNQRDAYWRGLRKHMWAPFALGLGIVASVAVARDSFFSITFELGRVAWVPTLVGGLGTVLMVGSVGFFILATWMLYVIGAKLNDL